MFSKKATKFDEIFTIDVMYYVSVKLTVKISSIFVAFLENINFISLYEGVKKSEKPRPFHNS